MVAGHISCHDEAAGVLTLTRATDPSLAGAKASALARASAAGLPVLDGFVLTPATAKALVTDDPAAVAAAHEAWRVLSEAGRRPLVVRSSSTVEDLAESSMAGRFRSVLDVRDWGGFLGAVREVVASAETAVLAGLGAVGEMAVLVQRYLVPEAGGVMFGADPVSGRRDRIVVAAVAGGPDALVSGTVDGVQCTLDRRGRLVEPAPAADALVPRVVRRDLVALARRAEDAFGGPQDVEWAVTEGRLVLLQSRPITVLGGEGDGAGPVLGPGPLAETFPDALSALERELWVDPMRDAIREVLVLLGVESPRRIAASPIVVTVGGRVAVDLVLLGVEPDRSIPRWLQFIDPRPPMRRLRSAWRLGRLRVALSGLADDVCTRVDTDLASVPPLGELTDRELCTLLRRVPRTLLAVYGHEMLAALLLEPATRVSAASVALRVLAEDAGTASDDELIARHPVLLALLPPRIGPRPPLPEPPSALPPVATGDAAEMSREALRLRSRWLQELSAGAAWELAIRLHRDGRLAAPELVRALPLDTLVAAVDKRTPRIEAIVTEPDPGPLPARFRLSAKGGVVPSLDGEGTGEGRGAGGGVGQGTVQPADALPRPGAVLVVRTLDPGLAPLLPGLSGLVAETGSVLSHLAILAREFGVPTAVGVRDAVRRFPPGTRVVVDGRSGAVSVSDGRGS